LLHCNLNRKWLSRKNSFFIMNRWSLNPKKDKYLLIFVMLLFCFIPCFEFHRCENFKQFDQEILKYFRYYRDFPRKNFDGFEHLFPMGVVTSSAKPVIGKGGYGTVYSVDLDIQGKTKSVVGKVISLKKYKGFDNFYDSVKMEIELLCLLLERRHILQIIDFGMISSNDIIIFTEKASGDVMSLIMNRILDTQTRFQIIENVIDAISDLHSLELIHRDLKWENVLYFENKEEITVKLADFGLSATCLMVDGKVGTFHTMAPEVRNCRSQYYGKPTDIFSLSIMISDLLECEFPIIPKMEHIDPMTRPNISQVKDMFLNYTILYGKMSSKAKEDVSELKNTLSLKEKLFIIESVLSQTNDLHMSG
jgi:serine/threonine protein kinase